MPRVSEYDKSVLNEKAAALATAREYKKIMDIMEKVILRETQNPEGMHAFLGYMLGLMCSPDLIDPNRFWKNTSKGKMKAWDLNTCNMLAKTLPVGAQEMYSRIVKALTKDERENRMLNKHSRNTKVEHDVMSVIGRDALRSVMENEIEVVEKYMNEDINRQKNYRRMLTACREKRRLCRCYNRCLESYNGDCIKTQPKCNSKKNEKTKTKQNNQNWTNHSRSNLNKTDDDKSVEASADNKPGEAKPSETNTAGSNHDSAEAKRKSEAEAEAEADADAIIRLIMGTSQLFR